MSGRSMIVPTNQSVKKAANRQNASFVLDDWRYLFVGVGALTTRLDNDILYKKLALQGILTYCATRPLPYHLYADEGALLVLPAPLTSVSLSKTSFLTD